MLVVHLLKLLQQYTLGAVGLASPKCFGALLRATSAQTAQSLISDCVIISITRVKERKKKKKKALNIFKRGFYF